MFAVVLALVLTGCGALQLMAPPQRQATPTIEPAPPAPVRQAATDVADPVRIRVPAVGIDAPVGPLFVGEDGVLPPPENFDATGWWHDGPEPGEPGPAVIAGHVDSYRGPAVFFRLGEIDPGDEIVVDRADGSTITFVAQRTEQRSKDRFPTRAVYGDTSGPTLRLITCGGEFEQQGRRYLDNIIVYATAVTG